MDANTASSLMSFPEILDPGLSEPARNWTRGLDETRNERRNTRKTSLRDARIFPVRNCKPWKPSSAGTEGDEDNNDLVRLCVPKDGYGMQVDASRDA